MKYIVGTKWKYKCAITFNLFIQWIFECASFVEYQPPCLFAYRVQPPTYSRFHSIYFVGRLWLPLQLFFFSSSPLFRITSIGIFFPADLFASINGKRTTHKDNDVRLLEIRIFPIWLSHNRHYTAERNSQARTNGKFIFKYYTNELPYVGASALQIICVQQIRVFDGNKSGKGVKGGSFIHYSDCLHIFFHPPAFSFHFRRLYVSEKSCACVWPSFAADRQYQQKWYENKYHLWNGFVISMRCHIKLN